ncbi:MAG: RsmB/NOP family class I SAM-dependent RNA methyltransferase [Myxococcota bacterium]|nr:RsmB/NOP family class I SAM-dependent RNA methyltransferase [Myxococcota bacterium]
MPDLLRCALPEPDPSGLLDRPFLTEAAAAALDKAREQPDAAGAALSRWFRKNRRLGSKTRRLVSEAVYGIIRQEGILRRTGAVTDAELIAGYNALLSGDRLASLTSEGAVKDYATALALPEAIAAEWLEALGEAGAAALGTAMAGRAPTILRANTVRCTAEQLVTRLAKEGVSAIPGGIEGAVVLTQRANLTGLPAFRAGWFEVQDEASQRLCAAIPMHAGQTVLDLCAGAGGKSLALAARGGRITASDTRKRALDELEKRAKRAGAKVRVGRPKPSDVVLVDAPCSGTGRLRREPALRWRLDGLDLTETIALQRRLLAQGAEQVRDGGLLVYATCSLLAAERTHADPSGFTRLSGHTLWPHTDGTDGFSWIIWRKA